jgi:hypothetical protein
MVLAVFDGKINDKLALLWKAAKNVVFAPRALEFCFNYIMQFDRRIVHTMINMNKSLTFAS